MKTTTYRPSQPANNAQLALVASVACVLMFVTVEVLRSGFGAPVNGLAKLAGLSLLVVNVAAFGSQKKWLLSGPALSFLALVLLSILGLSPWGVTSAISAPLAGGGFALFVYNFAVRGFRFRVTRLLGLLLVGAFLGVYAESMYWRSGAEHDVVYPEALVAGQTHTDVVEQAAVVNMISTFRVASTGLQGVVPLKYHNGSLWMAEGLRRLCGLSALDFIAFGYGIVLLPLYVAAFLGAALQVRVIIQGNIADAASPTFWFASLVALVGLFPFVNDPIHLNFNETILNSDSFLLAIALTLLLIGVAGVASGPLRSGNLSRYEKLALALILPGALALIGFVKISQLYLVLSIVIYICLRINWLRNWAPLTGVGLSCLLLLYFLHAEVGANKTRFDPLNFDRVPPEWIPYFFVFYFVWVWLLVIVWARTFNIGTLRELSSAVQERKSIAVELVFVAAAAGLLPYLLINFNSPSWKFFTEFHAVLAGLFVAAYAEDIRPRQLGQQFQTGSIRVGNVLLLVLMFAVSGHLAMTTIGSLYRMLKRSGEVRAILAGRTNTEWRAELRQIRKRRPITVEKFLDRTRVMECLSSLNAQPASNRRTTALYIPKTNRAYWDMRQVGQGATPFIAPALSGMAMVDGLPEYEDIGWAAIGWGYPQYDLPTAPKPPESDVQHAVQIALSNGFTNLLVFAGVGPSGCELSTVAAK
jgi:hypothetical protein